MSEQTLRNARVLITGASGFVGTHLSRCLLAEGAQVHSVERERLGQMRALQSLIEGVRPTHIFHLAGILGTAPGGWAAQYEANVAVTSTLLETVLASRTDPWIMISSSSAVYGATTPAENPLHEDRPLRPLTPYGVSHVAREMLALQFYLAHGLRTVRVRTFNLVGPGQPETLLASALTRQVASAEHEGVPAAIRVGNLFPKRDYTDVRDAVRAYVLLAATAQGGGVYNVCSGRSMSVQTCLDVLTRLVSVPVQIAVDPARVRTLEISDQVGDARGLRQATGWEPKIPLASSLHDMLAFWRSRLQVGSQV